MKSSLSSSFLMILTASAFLGCKKESKVDATVPLQQSFQSAEAPVKEAVQVATANLQKGNYAEATRALSPVVSGRPLSDSQRQAVGLALRQINQAVAANPALDTKEMFQLREKMYRAVDSGPRF